MKTILVIEDDQAVCQAIKTTLEQQGFQVIEAASGTEGIERIASYHPDLVLCDADVPNSDGYAVLETIRQDDAATGTPFIFLSSQTDPSDIRRAMNLGADDYLTKPFTNDELLSSVKVRINRLAAIAAPYHQDMKRAIDSLNQVAFYDSVTRLPNLILLHQSLEEQLSRIKEQAISLDDWTIAVLNIHVLHQDWVARSNKLPLSEPLLRAIAKRLKTFAEQTRAPFNNLVTRLGSHQFALVLYNDDRKTDIFEAVNDLISALQAPYEIDQYPIKLIAKVGGARCPQDGLNASALFSRAEIAAHHCVQDKDTVHRFFVQAMEDDYYLYRQLVGDIQFAMERNEFQLLYQPQLNTISERITGVEALLRWQHPKFGQIAYDQFIEIAEEAKLLQKLGQWVVQTACKQLQEWRSLTLIPLQLSINIWRQQLQDTVFVEHLLEALREYDLDPKQLILDIDEASLVAFDYEVISPILREITATGIQIAVDEFGTHGMPLEYLKTLPIKIIKPSRELVKGILENESNAIMIESMIDLAQRLKLKAHAKGVETDAHLKMLTRYGCHTVQGYQYSKPIQPSDFKAMLSQGLNETVYPC
jgi:EAL domain-containing protein (putative c-di-GMP-specific phosphodiesterase class I)/DNA-binding response OmpR family regulator